MRQIFLALLLRQLSRSDPKISASPKMPSPVSSSQIREALEPFGRTASFDTPHDLARRPTRWRRDKQMHVVSAHDTFENLYLKRLTGLANRLPHLQTHVTLKYLMPIFCNKIQSDTVAYIRYDCRTDSPSTPPYIVQRVRVADKSARLKAMALTLPRNE